MVNNDTMGPVNTEIPPPFSEKNYSWKLETPKAKNEGNKSSIIPLDINNTEPLFRDKRADKGKR